MTRSVQQSMLDGVPEKGVGPLLGSVQRGTNADLIATIAPIYLTGTVLDVTYGDGGWWTRHRPDQLVAHDKYKGDGVDYHRLPEADGSYDAVCFDPPYVPQGGTDNTSERLEGFRSSYGLAPRAATEDSPSTLQVVFDDMAAGLAECARVSRRWVLVKCCDFTHGRQFHMGSLHMLNTGIAIGLRPHDLIVHHTGPGPGGSGIIDVKRTRRHHSYLIVFSWFSTS